jgi:NADPH:quinone reductase-like Zn-dependent oxidoreductase
MKLRYKVALTLLGLLFIAFSSLALLLAHTTPCGPTAIFSGEGISMKAVSYRCYGSPEVLEYGETEKPAPGSRQVLVKVHAAALNPMDWHFMRGKPYIMRLMSGLGVPSDSRLGTDFAGTIEAVGADVTRFKPGDAVFGGAVGAFAEYLVVDEDRALALKPDNISFEQAAAAPVAALTALQALRDKGQLQAGQSVLINGASGGVGSFAVQIASAWGAEVTGVCSTRNVDMVRALGADHVIDYTRNSYIESGRRYDLIIDMVGNYTPLENRAVLNPGGAMVMVGGPTSDWLVPLLPPIQAMLLSALTDQRFVSILARLKGEDLDTLAELMRDGKLNTAIDRHYPLSDTAEAIRYLEEGHARGKVIIDPPVASGE